MDLEVTMSSNAYMHYYGSCRNIHLEYDAPHTVNGKTQVPIQFVQPDRHDAGYARTIAPTCTEWDIHGIDTEKMEELKAYLEANMDLLLQKAELVRGEDEGTVNLEIELPVGMVYLIDRISHADGMSSAGWMRECVKESIGYFEGLSEKEMIEIREEYNGLFGKDAECSAEQTDA